MIGINKEQNRYFDYLVDPSFHGVNRLIAWKHEWQRSTQKKICIPKAEIKDYNVIIDGRNFFD